MYQSAAKKRRWGTMDRVNVGGLRECWRKRFTLLEVCVTCAVV